MRLIRTPFFVYFFLCFPLLWDGHVSFIVNEHLISPFNITSYIFLMFVFYTCFIFRETFTFLFFLPYGFIYDSYYFKSIGIVLISLPLLFYVLSRIIKRIQVKTYGEILLFFLLIFFFECLNFGLGYLYEITRYSVSDFIIYQLSPTLLFNIVLFIILRNPIRKLLSYTLVDRIK